jgi:broad specificity phosphatase PhoE
MNQTWYLFRHALATYSTTGYGDQILTASILPEAVEPINKIAQYLNSVKPSSNFTSEILRCLQTTVIITGITKQIFINDSRLNEFYKEKFNQFSKRIESFVHDVSQIESPNIIICTHGSVISGIRHFVANGKFNNSDLFKYPACGELLEIVNKKCIIHNFNI